ncbi:UNVERIFIED_CONTAM: hypothetical protein GTU68_013489, partial [Idotea baltica]|nr:hypothetical protein [Idotea baltica]
NGNTLIGTPFALQTNSNISHDHGYIEFEDAFNNIKVEKEEVVESSDHSQHLEFNSDSSHPPSTSSPPSEPENQHKSADPLPSYPSEIPESQDSAKLKNTKRKGRLKGKGKFIGQSKDEKEMALSLIDKIKSQSLMQMDNLECTICDPPRVFTAPSTLLSHYKSHAGIRPYVCSLCEAVFTRQHSLNYHLLIHSNQTRFTCDDCGRKFRHPSHFKEHRRRHTGESPYECMDCLMRFKTRNTYKRHLRTRHGKKLTTQGSICIVANDDSEG